MARNEQKVSVDGHQLKLTSLDKVYYPQTGTTKGQVLDYYARIAPFLIPHARDRIATRKRWVDGVGTPEKPGKVFFEKELPEGAPSCIPSRKSEHSTGTKWYPLVQDQATLTYLVQMDSLELYIPQWRVLTGSSDPGTITSETRYPDRMVFDLDPGEGRELADCVEVAHLVRELLNGMGLDVFPLTSGSKGIHLYAPLDGSSTSQEVSDVAHELARSLEADHPDLIVSAMKKKLRKNKVFIDWSQNSASKTTVAPYSLRGRFTPTVATPRTWDELADPASVEHLRFEEVLERVEDLGDLLEPLAQSAGAEDAGALAEADPAEAPQDRLTTYRSMRDPDKTPEPVPDRHGSSGDELIFVIQEHHARRLHWDFRLEHDGVLVSWALPKGPPTDPKQNHLAIQTEDHPMEYAKFEGTIPKGEYGGGEVTIWDWGTYEVEKWRDGKEVTAILHGQPDGGLGGTKEFALFNTGDHGPNDDPAKNWLIHLKESSADEKTADTTPRDEDTGSETEPAKKPDKADPADYTPMLATLGKIETARAHTEDWAFEMKWDGVRAIATVEAATDNSPGAVTLTSRNGLDMTDTYPELAELAECVSQDCVLDGEIVAFGDGGYPEFGRLQRRIKLTKTKDIEKERASTPVYLMVFDILNNQGQSLLWASYEKRREQLFDVVSEGENIYLPEAFDGSLDDAMAASKKLKLEGVMAKKKDSVYLPGKRTKTWLKLKHSSSREVLIVGWREGEGGRQNTFGSLLIAAHDEDGELTYLGRVGTGFDDHQLRDLRDQLDDISRKTPPVEVPSDQRRDAHWVTPKLVADVEYGGVTRDGRLRHPVWRGLREDIDPDDVTV